MSGIFVVKSARRFSSGHLFFDRKFSKISVHLAPSFLHQSAVLKVQQAVWDVITANVQNHDETFDLWVNAGGPLSSLLFYLRR